MQSLVPLRLPVLVMKQLASTALADMLRFGINSGDETLEPERLELQRDGSGRAH